MDVSVAIWAVSLGIVGVLIIGDLLLHLRPKEVSLRSSAIETIVWTAFGLAFTGFVYAVGDGEAAAGYFAGYLLERALSVDNVFVFVLILSYFSVPARLQHRVLLFGVVCALVLRAVFIVLGAALLEEFEWMIYLFGAFLLITSYKLFCSGDEEVDPSKNPALRLLRKIVPVSDEYSEHKLVVKVDSPQNGRGKRMVTPLLAVLVVLATTDLVFALDSIPAIFAVTRESYLVFTSNAFALMGLVSMSFLLARVMDRFAYLKHALAIVLALVGLKMMISGVYHVNIWLSLVVIALVIAGGVVASLVVTRPTQSRVPESENLASENFESQIVKE